MRTYRHRGDARIQGLGQLFGTALRTPTEHHRFDDWARHQLRRFAGRFGVLPLGDLDQLARQFDPQLGQVVPVRILAEHARGDPLAHHLEGRVVVVRDTRLDSEREIDRAFRTAILGHALGQLLRIEIERLGVERVGDHDPVGDPPGEHRDLRAVGGEIDRDIASGWLEEQAAAVQRDNLAFHRHFAAAQQGAHHFDCLAHRRDGELRLYPEFAESRTPGA